ncbi:MAG: DNA polymerase III subunit delta' [Myxococcaceae bacterium]|nr:DNA polymerase III subunit delta' [Myxococcaceae bacterium]
MSLADVKCQDRAVAALEAALSRGHVHHAWLFHGPDGVGKELAAFGLAQALICTEQPNAGCGVCAACRRVHKRNHPDVTVVMPDDELVRRGMAGRSDFERTPSRDIRIEQVRQLQERLAFRALESKTKVAVLLTAHAMNPSAQNALLKTLEEPPAGTVLILVSSAPDKLLPTIRSRCAKASFGPLPVDFLAARLMEGKKGVDEATAKQAAMMAGGSLARALSLDVDALGERKDIIERFEALQPMDARGWLAMAETLGDDRVTAEVALDVLQVWLRDVQAAQVPGAPLVNVDLQPLAVAAAAKVSAAALHRRNLLIDEARNAITQRNGAVRLQLERMFVEMFAG